MLTPFVSVVVPVYKAENTIHKCVDSLLAQTLHNFEILLIDDGSPDRCGKICDEYARKDQRIRVFHQYNQGVSAARQCGIDNARGEYSIHADPDDWVEPTMLENLYGKAKEEDADMVICDFYIESYKGQEYIKQQPSALDHKTVQKELFMHLHGSCCNKLIRRGCYCNSGMKFPKEISNYEDQYVICGLLNMDLKVAYLPEAFYHYVRNREGSLSRLYSLESHKKDILARDLFLSLLKDADLAQMVFRQKSYVIFASSFYGGQKQYTSYSFKKEFSSFENYVREFQGSSILKVFMILACRGYYQSSIKLFYLMKKLKRFIMIRK